MLCCLRVYCFLLLVAASFAQQIQFEQPSYFINFDEEQPSGTIVGEIAASYFNSFGLPRSDGNFSIPTTGDAQLFTIETVYDTSTSRGVVRSRTVFDRDDVNGQTRFSFTATYTIPEGVSDTVSITIIIQDINDNAPAFPSPINRVPLLENTLDGTQFTLISAADPDQVLSEIQVVEIAPDVQDVVEIFIVTNGRLLYNITAGNELGHFSIDRETGGLSISEGVILNIDAIDMYNLTVMVTDGGGLNDSTIVIIDVVDTNDNTPQITGPLGVNVMISEDTQNGYIIVDHFNATDADRGINAEIRFLISSGDVTDSFSIDELSGRITVSAPLDRERGGVVTLTVVARDRGIPQTLQSSTEVVINLLDVNDNAPQFVATTFSVSESVTPPALVAALEARDPDEGLNGTVTYQILKGADDIFTIDNTTGVIRTLVSLDHEEVDSYELLVQAFDNPTNDSYQLSTEVNITIIVEDANDNAPMFLQDAYNASILDNQRRRVEILRVTATDADSGSNGQLRYIISVPDPTDGDAFRVNETTGVIYRERRIIFEDQSMYTFTVQALDGGAFSFADTTQVTIFVHNVNENPPVFEQPEYNATVNETITNNTVVLTVSAQDEDVGLIGEVRYRIVTGFDKAGSFGVNETSGEVFVSSRLDFDVREFVFFMVEAFDGGFPEPYTDRTNVTVYLRPENDEPPSIIFPKGFYPTVPENYNSSFEVVELAQYTFDPDFDAGGEFTFRLVEIFDEFSQNDSFSFNETNGLITSLRTFDRELQPNGIRIAIETIDFGTPQQSQVINITIMIGDRNDNAPYFESNATVEVYEFMPPGITVPLNYTALDEDIDSNAELEYAIYGGEGSERFTINATTGQLFTAEVLNKTEQLFYNLTIMVSDRGVPSLFGFGFVMIEVIDANDQIPIFSESVYNFTLLENSPSGTFVAFVNATDSDIGTNANFVYAFPENSTNSDLFTINATSGEIVSNVEFDRENISVVDIEVFAIDKGLVPLTGSATVRVYIQDANDHTPFFNTTSYFANVTENAVNETILTTVLAFDNDAESPNNDITFILIGERSENFIVNSSTGNVLVAGDVDWEEGSEFTVIVVAMDGGFPSRNDTAELTIYIQDVNDVAPMFVPSSLNLSILENSRPGNMTEVGCVVARDPDSPGNNSRITYTIIMDFSNGRFELDPETGCVTFVRHFLNREVRDLYDLLIRASDHGDPQLQTDARLYISVVDANEFGPIFDSEVYRGSVEERAPIGTPILTVRATDIDVDLNGELRYSISNNSLFQIDNITGVIATASEYDFESVKSYYRFEVTVTDLGSPVRFNDSAQVIISILDSNDNIPVFEETFYSGTIRENLAPGTTILQVIATDDDSTTNAEIEYTLPLGVSQYLGVDPLTGVLYTRQFIDREGTPEFNFNITANNSQALFPLHTTVNVFMNVSDLNDMHPTFDSVIDVNVLRNTTVNSVVYTLTPQDGDEGRNGTVTFELIRDNELFYLNETNGDIVLSRELGSGTQEVYILAVRATDNGTESLSGYTNVLLRIVDVNDTAPQFFANSISTTIGFTADQGSFVAKLEAFDIEDSEIVYSIVSGNELGLFELASESNGIIQTSISLSSSLSGTDYTLGVRVQTSGQNAYSEGTVQVFISSGSANAPQFFSGNYSVTLSESLTAGENVFNFNGEYINIDNFTINSEFASVFDIGVTDGQVTLSASLDFETRRLYQLTIEGVRNGESVVAYTVLNVIVADVNEHTPQFISDSFFVALSETTPTTEPFFIAMATDEDGSPPANVITYSITTADSAIQSQFDVNPSTGGLFLRANLDYESGTRVFNFTISASNGQSLSSEANVEIIVLNGNTFSPIFRPNRYVLSFEENTDAGLSVLNISATDGDEGSSGDITYGLHGNHDYFDFRIDTFTGEIFINNRLDYERHSFYTLTVVAGDGGDPGRTGTAIVQVSIRDQNDNSPIWDSLQYAVVVSENVTVGTELITVLATDEDQIQLDENGNIDVDNGLITYSIVAGDPIGQFQITPDTGVVSVATTLNREETQVYNLTLRATDGGGRYNESYLHITLTDVNDQVPSFTQSPYIVGLPENSPHGVHVLTVLAIDTDLRESSELTYHFNNSGNFSDATNTFFLNDTTGDIFLISAIDREEQELYTVFIEAVDMGTTPLTGIVEVIVQIIDINEFAPVFTSANYSGRVFENEPFNTSALQVFTTDEDFGENSTILYSIIETSSVGLFDIVADTGVIVVVGDIDYESVQVVDLVVMATDSGPIETRLTNAVNVTVYIEDRNDNAPQLNETLTAFIAENFMLGELVLSIEAFDIDSGINSLLSYVIDPLGNSDVENTFSINSTSGEIFLIGDLNREAIPSYIFGVNVTDGGTPSLLSNSVVTVYVVDINDNVPRFIASFFEGSIVENSPNNTAIVTVEATDDDIGPNADIVYSIISSLENRMECFEFCGSQSFCSSLPVNNTSINADIPFIVNPTTGLIESSRPLDRESVANYVLLVEVADSPVNETRLNATTCVHIAVIDLNDDTPTFTEDVYSAGLTEAAAMGMSVLTVVAGDQDAGNNSVVTYELISGTDSFTIEPTTGIIRTLIGRFDREMRDEYTLTVVATDGGVASLSSSADIVITILDENDSPPEFSQALYFASIMENLPTNSFVFQVIASDADIGRNAQLIYSIVSISPPQEHFAIDPLSGNLTSTSVLDRENIGSYNLTIMARDNGTISLSNTAIVNVQILDDNDHSPVFTNVPYTSTINENTLSLLQSLITLTATDSDLGTNADVYFNIESVSPPSDAFLINSTSGEIFVISELDAEYSLNYTLIINANNGDALPRQSSKVNVDIQVTDLNDEVPYFSQSDFVTPLLEATPIRSDVITLPAFDDDATIANSILNFEITGGENRSLFEVNVTTGIVYVAGVLDRETEPVHILEVTVFDNGVPTLNATVSLTIILQDFNDNPPVFDQTSYSFRVDENVPTRTLVGTVMASDLDIQTITYSLANTTHFIINSTTGEIFSSAPLDREEQEVHEFIAIATDVGGGTLQRSTEVMVNVSLLDLNDVIPSFPGSPYAIEWHENTTIGIVLFVLEGLDADLRENGDLFYTLLSGNDSSFFSVNGTSGELLLMEEFDREEQNVFTVQVTATDRGTSSLTGTAVVVIRILDNNDNVPILNATQYRMSVPEDAINSTVVLFIGATDEDIDENANISFSLSNDFGGVFSIGAKNGVISLTGPLDYESVRSYNFSVIATDDGLVPLSNYSLVYVEVIDLNDNPPLFDAELYQVSIPENSILGSSVFQIPATDRDATTNSELRYTILSGNLGGVFAVDEIFGLISTFDYLDREVTPSYTLGLRVVDLGTPQFTATTVLTVSVQDVNDNPPEFELTEYSISISESSEIGSEVITVSGFDRDIDSNANLTYSIIEGNINDTFKIDEISGNITIIKQLDYETTPSYTLTLALSDNGLPSSLTDTAVLLISLTDANEAPPVFTSPTYFVDVAQNAVVGTPVGHMTADDADPTSNLEYSLLGGDDYFEVDSLEGTVFVSEPLEIGSHMLTLSATDGDHVTNVIIIVTVVPIDVAMATVFFPQPAFLFEISESAPLQSIIGFVYEFYFDITGGSDLFMVNGNGSIVLIGRLDYETTPTYIFNIETNTEPPRFSILTIRVLDANDNAPQFESDVYIVTTSELTEVGVRLLELRAFDRDSPGLNKQVTITLNDVGITEGGNFSIDPFNNELVLTGLLDYEVLTVHNLTVVATNNLADPALYSTAQVIVNVTDSNDNDPVFSESFYQVTISESVSMGTEILTLKAEDADSGSNSELVFAVTHLTTPLSFVVNVTSGGLFTNTTFNLTQDMTSSYIISASVADRGNPQPRSDTTTIFVEVIADNLFSPQFSQPNDYYAEVPETVSSGYEISTVSAVDPDDLSAAVQFRIEDGNTNNAFVINPSTGVIQLSTSLDFVRQSFYFLSISATDFGSPPRTSIVGVNISVIDINNHNPQFIERSYEVTVIENITIGEFLVQTLATDPDTINITYQITVNVFDNGTALFRIDPVTGEIFTAAVIDREFADVNEILVSAIDSGYPVQRSQSIPVRIFVQDLNDNRPVFDQLNYTFPVVRLLGSDQTVGMAVATDADIVGEDVSYFISSDSSDGLFRIDSNTGYIRTNAVVPEVASLPGYELVVMAFDGFFRTNVSVFLRIVNDGQFCNSEGFCTLVREVNCTFDIFPFIECNPFCVGPLALSPQRRVCISHYCMDANLVPCVAMETCLPPNRACAGECPDRMSVCPTTDLCHVTSLAESCDQTNETCLVGQTLIQRNDSSRYCEITNERTENCTSEGLVFCESLEECRELTDSYLCLACPAELAFCADTGECVRDVAMCCGAEGYYCDVLDSCLDTSLRCELPNIAPVVATPLVYLETVEDFRPVEFGDGFVISSLLGDSEITMDSQGEELSIAIVQASDIQSSYGEWQYAVCEDELSVSGSGDCSDIFNNWISIDASVLSETNALVLPSTARVRFVRRAVELDGGIWLRVKLWDGNIDGFVSMTSDLVRSHTPSFETTIPFSSTSAYSQNTTLLVIVILPLISPPEFNANASLQLTSIQEDIVFANNLGDQISDIVFSVDIPNFAELSEDKIEGFEDVSQDFSESQLPRNVRTTYYQQVTIVNPTRRERISAAQRGSSPGVAILFPPDTARGIWQVSLTGDSRTFVNLNSILTNLDDILLLSTAARLRFLPELDFCGFEQISVRPWDGYWDTTAATLSENGYLIVPAPESDSSAISTINLNRPVGLEVNVICEQDKPVVLVDRVSLDPIPYRVAYRYERLFTMTVERPAPLVREERERLTDYLLLTLETPVNIKKISPLAGTRSTVSFSVDGDVHSFPEVVSMVRNLNDTLSLLGYTVLDLSQDAWYGPGAGCRGADQPQHNHGVHVNSFFSPYAFDGDNDFIGLAVVSMETNTQGAWQYYRGNWSSNENRANNYNPLSNIWINFPASVELSERRAFLLHGNDRIRYSPHPDVFWSADSAPSISVKIWDGSLNGLTPNSEISVYNINTDSTVDTVQSLLYPRGRFSDNVIVVEAARLGCNGGVNSGLVHDVCCVCGGSGASCEGCDGVTGSNAVYDACDVCGTTVESNCLGCDFIPFSGTEPGRCTECISSVSIPTETEINNFLFFDPVFTDCNGDCYGNAVVDNCTVCSGGNTQHTPNSDMDCAGQCFGAAVVDDCGDCTGPTQFNANMDCTGVCNGAFLTDSCGVCQLANDNGMIVENRDCEGVCFGTAVLDTCDECVGGSTNLTAKYLLDACGVCGGDNSSCVGCDGGVASGQVIDSCGECGGNNCGCFQLNDITPNRGPRTGRTEVIVRGAGFFLNDTDRLQFEFDKDAVNCGAPYSFPNVIGGNVRITCLFQSSEQQETVFATPIDQSTARCVAGPTVQNQVYIRDFTLRVRIDNGLFSNPIPFFYDDYSNIEIISLYPTALETNVEASVSFIGSNFLNTTFQVCLLYDFERCNDDQTTQNPLFIPATFISSSEVSCRVPPAIVPCQVTLRLSLDGQESGIIDTTATTFTYQYSAPEITSVHFSADLSRLLINFDRQVELAPSVSMICSEILSPDTLSLVGEDADCNWADGSQRQIVIILSRSANIQVNSPVAFVEDVLLTRDQLYSFAVDNTRYFVDSVRNAVQPRAVLNGPGSIPACGSFSFSGIHSQYPGYGGLQYHWNVHVQDSSLDGYSDIISSIESFGTSSDITLSSDHFLPQIEYYLQLFVVNSIGLQSETKSVLLVKDSEPRPFVFIRGDSNKMLRADEDLIVEAVVTTPTCFSESLTYDYTWTLIKIIDKRRGITAEVDLSSLKISSPAIIIPESYFTDGMNYTLTVRVSADNGMEFSSQEVINVIVSEVSLQAVIDGGDRVISIDRALVLDGRNSVYDATVSISWSCQIVGSLEACYNRSETGLIPNPISIPRNAFVSFPASHLNSGLLYMFTLTLSRGDEISTASVSIEIVTGRPPIVEIVDPGSVVSSRSVVLEGFVHTSLPVETVTWESLQVIGQGSIDLADPNIVQSQVTYETTPTLETTSLSDYPSVPPPTPISADIIERVNLVISPNTLTPDLSYMFRLTARTNQGAVYSQVTITPSSPPRQTQLLVSPSSGISFETEFSLEAVNSLDDSEDSPFQYSFGIVEGSDIDIDEILIPDGMIDWISGIQVSNKITTFLPANSELVLLVRVYDRNGGMSDTLSQVTVNSNRDLNNGNSFASIVTEISLNLLETKDWSRAMSDLIALTLEMNAQNAVNENTRVEILDLLVRIFDNYLPPSHSNYQLVNTLLSQLTENGGITDSSQENRITTIINTILEWYENEIQFEQISNSVATQNDQEPLFLKSSYSKETKNFVTNSLAADILNPLSNIWSASPSAQLSKDYVRSVDHMTRVLCKAKSAGEQPSVIDSDFAQLYAHISQPIGPFNISGTIVNFQNSVNSLYEAEACSLANRPCLETCITGAVFASDFLNPAPPVLPLSSDASNMLISQIEGSNPQGIEIFSEIISTSISIPSQNSYVQVLELPSPIQILIPMSGSVPNGSHALCLYRNVGGGGGFDTNQWQLDSVQPPAVTSFSGQNYFSCEFNHLTEFVIGLLPEPVITTQAPPTTPPPTTPEPTTQTTTPPRTTPPEPTTSAPIPVSSPIGPIVAIIILLLLIAVAVTVTIIAIVVWKKKRSRSVKIGPAMDETDGDPSLTKAGPLTPEESKVPMQIILCADKGERTLVGKMNVLPSIRLRELRYQLGDNFDMFKKKPFYFLTRQLCDIEPAAEQQQFVSLVFGDKPIFVREVTTVNELTKKHFCICGNAAQFECSNCSSQGYCSPECQLEHWGDQHQKQCGRMSERRRRSDVLSGMGGASAATSPVGKPSRRITLATSPTGGLASSLNSPTDWKDFMNAGKSFQATPLSPQPTESATSPRPSLYEIPRPSLSQQATPRAPPTLGPSKKLSVPARTLPPLSRSSSLLTHGGRPSLQHSTSLARPNFYSTSTVSPPPSLQPPVRSQPDLFTKTDPQQIGYRPQPPSRRISITSVGSEELGYSINMSRDLRNEPLMESDEEDYESSSNGSHTSPAPPGSNPPQANIPQIVTSDSSTPPPKTATPPASTLTENATNTPPPQTTTPPAEPPTPQGHASSEHSETIEQ